MPVAKRVDGERYLNALKLGLVPYFTKDLQKARKAEATPVGDGFQIRNVQRGLCETPMPGAGASLL